MQIKKQLRLNNNDISKFSNNLFQGDDANYLTTNVRTKGLINFSFLLDFKYQFQQKLSMAITKFNSKTLTDDLNNIYNVFNDVIDTIF